MRFLDETYIAGLGSALFFAAPAPAFFSQTAPAPDIFFLAAPALFSAIYRLQLLTIGQVWKNIFSKQTTSVKLQEIQKSKTNFKKKTKKSSYFTKMKVINFHMIFIFQER